LNQRWCVPQVLLTHLTLFYLTHLSNNRRDFTALEPKSFLQAMQDSKWRDVMHAVVNALESTQTWNLTPLPLGNKPIEFKWVYKIKYQSDGSVE